MKYLIHCGAAALPLLLCGTAALADHGAGDSFASSSGSPEVVGPDTLAVGGAAFELGALLALPQDRSDAELEALAARHVHAHTSDYVLTARLGAAYGVTDRLSVSASLPLVHREALREGEHGHAGGMAHNEVVQLGDVTGIGDLVVNAKYRVTSGAGVQAALIGGLKLPTGRTGVTSLEGERLETEHQPGSGSWDPIAGASLGFASGADRFDASVLYHVSTRGAQDTRLGDRLRAGAALAHRFGPGDHHDGGEGGEAHGHAAWDVFAALAYEWEGQQRVGAEREEDSGGEVLWLAPGARHVTAGGLAFAASLAVPLWQDIGLSHPENRLRLNLSAARSF